MSHQKIISNNFFELYRNLDEYVHLSTISYQTGERSITKGLHYKYTFKSNGKEPIELSAMDIEMIYLTEMDEERVTGLLNTEELPEFTSGGAMQKSLKKLISFDMIVPEDDGVHLSDRTKSGEFYAELYNESHRLGMDEGKS